MTKEEFLKEIEFDEKDSKYIILKIKENGDIKKFNRVFIGLQLMETIGMLKAAMTDCLNRAIGQDLNKREGDAGE